MLVNFKKHHIYEFQSWIHQGKKRSQFQPMDSWIHEFNKFQGGSQNLPSVFVSSNPRPGSLWRMPDGNFKTRTLTVQSHQDSHICYCG